MRSQQPISRNSFVLKMGPTLRFRTGASLIREGTQRKAEETLVPDDRAQARPAQLIDAKLLRMLKTAFVPVSQILDRGTVGRR